MSARALLVLAMIAVVGGCATSRLEQLDATLRAYERALRWSDFQAAFALAGNADAPLPDFRRLRDIRVTSYDVIGAPRANEDALELEQLVEIRYANLGNMAERLVTDRQIWVYSARAERWKLRSAFPHFP